jgi:hypothetical protein
VTAHIRAASARGAMFPPELVDMTVHGCEGIDVFVFDSLDEDTLDQGRRFRVIEVASPVVGAVELVVLSRRRASELHQSLSGAPRSRLGE